MEVRRLECGMMVNLSRGMNNKHFSANDLLIIRGLIMLT